MLDTFGVCTVAVLVLSMMLILFVDVVRRNHATVYSMADGATQAVDDEPQGKDVLQVYPTYVDCSRDYVSSYSSDASDVEALVQKQGA